MLTGLILALGINNKPLPPESEEQGIIEKIRAGLRFVFNNQIILGAISLDLFAVLFGGAVALLPIFANEILMVGPEGLRRTQGISFGRGFDDGFLHYASSH